MLIPEGSSVIIQDRSFNIKNAPVEAATDIEVVANQIMLIEGYLCCTIEYAPVKDLGNGTYQIDVYAQDALVIRDGHMYKDMSDAE